MRNLLTLLVISVATLVPMTYAYSYDDSKPLPINASLVAMDTPTGLQLFEQSRYKANALNLLEYFVTQKYQAFCSIASDVMVANATGIPRPQSARYAPYHLFTQSNVFNPKTIAVNTPLLVSQRGQTLNQNQRFLTALGLNATAYHVTPAFTFTHFESVIKKALDTPGVYIIVNYLRTRASQVGGGHMSPIAAYDAKSDRLLLLDVARYKYPAVWIKSNDLFQAMQTVDPTNKQFRGFIIIRK